MSGSSDRARVLAGRYELGPRLGAGAMGVVLEARDRRTGRPVAIKLLHPGATPQRLARLAREAQALARLDHPGIVRVLDVSTGPGEVYLAMELVPGARTLEQALPGLELAQRVELILQAARALGHAHAQGVVHRDVKGENLLLDRDDRVRVTDFGVALVGDELRLSLTGGLVGTPDCMAPEQLRGEKELGPPVDVWALGVLLYQALTGRRPYAGGSLVTLSESIGRPPAPPRALEPTLSPALEAVCLRALAHSPAQRFADAGRFAAALASALEGATSAPPTRRRPLGAPLIAIGLLLAGVAAAVAIPLLRQAPPGPTTPPTPAALRPERGAPPAGGETPRASAPAGEVPRVPSGQRLYPGLGAACTMTRLGSRLFTVTVCDAATRHLELRASHDDGRTWRLLPGDPLAGGVAACMGASPDQRRLIVALTFTDSRQVDRLVIDPETGAVVEREAGLLALEPGDPHELATPLWFDDGAGPPVVLAAISREWSVVLRFRRAGQWTPPESPFGRLGIYPALARGPEGDLHVSYRRPIGSVVWPLPGVHPYTVHAIFYRRYREAERSWDPERELLRHTTDCSALRVTPTGAVQVLAYQITPAPEEVVTGRPDQLQPARLVLVELTGGGSLAARVVSRELTHDVMSPRRTVAFVEGSPLCAVYLDGSPGVGRARWVRLDRDTGGPLSGDPLAGPCWGFQADPRLDGDRVRAIVIEEGGLVARAVSASIGALPPAPPPATTTGTGSDRR